MGDATRRPHASLDVADRRRKAKKIERILALDPTSGPYRMLEVGTGSGIIAHYFGTQSSLNCEVVAVDVADQRVLVDGYEFELVTGTRLPFADESFDVVITNHVIEHVGEWGEQLRHLRELRRVLGSQGVGYLATPNRWAIFEPHYRLPLLSWLPSRFRSSYLRVARRGSMYDCEPLAVASLDEAFKACGLSVKHRELDAIALEDSAPAPLKRIARFLSRRSARVQGFAVSMSPTFVCVFEAND